MLWRAIVFALVGASTVRAQDTARATAAARAPWETSAVPALNFDADEGFGYGIVLQTTNYGLAHVDPYRVSVQPMLFLTTRGRRDLSVFVDAPHLLPRDWRLDLYVAREQQLATPYYGIGDFSSDDPALTTTANPYYYRFGRTGLRGTMIAQHALVGPLRALVGAGYQTITIRTVSFDSGTSLLAVETNGAGVPDGRIAHVRAGLVWDTRDREIGTTSGAWIEALVQRADRVAGGTDRFTRATLTARGYVPLSRRFVFAQRLVVQNLSGDVPFYDLFVIQNSLRDDEGLGGNSTIRGLPKDRYAGKGLLLSNSELRIRAADVRFLGRPSTITLSGFVDAGRVWAEGLRLSEAARDLRAGAGAGARIAYGPSFVVSCDVGHSPESMAAIYIGLGYLF